MNHLELLLDRLLLNHAEITYTGATAIRHVYRRLPVGSVAWDRIPFVYVEPGQETYSPVAQSAMDTIGTVIVTFAYQSSDNDRPTPPPQSGESVQIAELITIREAFKAYYFTHPRLHTEALNELGWLRPGTRVQLGSSRLVTLRPELNDQKIPKAVEIRGLEFPLTYVVRESI